MRLRSSPETTHSSPDLGSARLVRRNIGADGWRNTRFGRDVVRMIPTVAEREDASRYMGAPQLGGQHPNHGCRRMGGED